MERVVPDDRWGGDEFIAPFSFDQKPNGIENNPELSAPTEGSCLKEFEKEKSVD